MEENDLFKRHFTYSHCWFSKVGNNSASAAVLCSNVSNLCFCDRIEFAKLSRLCYETDNKACFSYLLIH